MDTNDKTYEWDKYIIKRTAIGKGSFSKVYYGWHKDTKQEIAMKRIGFSKLDNTIKNKVISEIMILQQMNHEHIMKLYEYKFDGDYIFLVTEYCNQNDLSFWMKESHTMDEKRDIMKQITIGMDYLHERNILHRDIKPENILLHNGVVKICDFGFSVMIKEELQMCMTICGTPLFMSPEILFMKPYTITSDIWSMGILFYWIIYGFHPFGVLKSLDDYRGKITLKIIYEPIAEIDHVIHIIKQMLAYRGENRPTTKQILTSFMQIEQPESADDSFDDFVPLFEMDEKDEKDEKDSRINELEEHIFKLESILKEKDREIERDIEREKETEYEPKMSSSLTCCFTTEEDDMRVTGRGKTNKGYEIEYMNIKQDYFTPPSFSETNGISIPRPKKTSVQSSSSGSNSSKGGSFLMNSLEKFMSMFQKPSFSSSP